MINGKKCIALIPARSGSKGIKDKNIKLLNGKPLIAHTIEFSLASDIIDHTIVSTDSNKYAEIAKKFGAEVPFLRPKEISQDNSKSIDAILHAIDWIMKNIENAEYLIYLQPTSPLREKKDIKQIVSLFFEKNADTIISLCEVDHPPDWIYSLTDDLKLKNLLGIDIPSKNRQELEKYYRVNGAYYFARISFLLENKSFFSKKTHAFVMPRERSIDIDTEFDFKLAEFFLKNKPIL